MDAIDLIARAQSEGEGAELAMNQLLKIIEKEHMVQRIGKFRAANVLVEYGDIQSAFLVGCYKAILKAKLDIGNPLLFILWSGQKHVFELFRTNLRHGVRVTCYECHQTGLLLQVDKQVVCSFCGTSNVRTFMTMVNEDQLAAANGTSKWEWDRLQPNDVFEERDMAFNEAVYDIRIEEIRKHLGPGRVRELFDILVVEGINRETSNNYIAEIALRWNVTQACVATYLRKLRKRLNEFIETGEGDRR